MKLEIHSNSGRESVQLEFEPDGNGNLHTVSFTAQISYDYLKDCETRSFHDYVKMPVDKTSAAIIVVPSAIEFQDIKVAIPLADGFFVLEIASQSGAVILSAGKKLFRVSCNFGLSTTEFSFPIDQTSIRSI